MLSCWNSAKELHERILQDIAVGNRTLKVAYINKAKQEKKNNSQKYPVNCNTGFDEKMVDWALHSVIVEDSRSATGGNGEQ